MALGFCRKLALLSSCFHAKATSHLQGILLRSLKLLEVGVHPVFVFDGRPPAPSQDALAAATCSTAS